LSYYSNSYIQLKEMAYKNLITLFGILIISGLIVNVTSAEDKNTFDPEDVEYFKEIGMQIAKFMCRHLDEVLVSLNITKDDML
jgi:cytochrome b subunit of formate dehydrogenase